ncbi:DUF983 domain-containing protein [Arsenicibacter rosenii]|uniref:DUF983 domain-containing protein n=1 Tax=Arsenicibacter rosenii TaxID=1750698 RepID=A0A1S2VHV1_9BACT|nr:DUF983 domain-containing protein [Arsenicibacter rosenii]OIN58322.1 DUF983 domain-containing protein [Arsenicibacter rosenii]
MLKGTKLYSILFNKCPRCQEGDFFITNNAYDLKRFDKMHTHCSHCDLRFEPEPGFFFGAMYVSYAFYVAFIISTFVLFNVLLQIDLTYYLIGLIPALIMLTPFFFRLARRTWINIFVRYKPDQAKAHS